MGRAERTLFQVLRGTADANIAFRDLGRLVREAILEHKLAQELGRAIPEPRGRLRFA